MADVPPGLTIHEVPWLRIFPWLRLFRAPGTAADPKCLMLAVLGIFLLHAGWLLLDRAMPEPPDGLTRLSGWNGRLKEVQSDHLLISDQGVSLWSSSPWEAFEEGTWRERVNRLKEPAWCLIGPFFRVFDPTISGRSFLKATLAGLWAIVVWGLVGGAIARIAVVKLTKGERVGLGEAIRFSGRKVVSLLGTPMVPLLGVVVIAAPLAALGLLYRLPGSSGALVAGILAFFPLIGGLLLTLIVVGLAVGWPLMHASVAAEAEDGFDAMSRSYAYVYQRPWHYAAYVALAVALGCLGLLFVDLFAGLVVRLAAWSLALGGPESVINAYYLAESRPALGAGPVSQAAAAHGFWMGVVSWLARGWIYAYFWTSATAIYLLLRRDVDGTPWGMIAHESRSSPLAEAAAGPHAVVNTEETGDSVAGEERSDLTASGAVEPEAR